MARFEFLALDAEGLSATGVVRAQDEAAARAQLARRRLAPVKLIIANDAARPERAVPGRRIGVDALALITRQLATLIRVSPVEEALRTIAAQEARPDLRAMLTATHAAVVEGQRLSEAMTRQGRAFPPLYRAMVAAGEAAGAPLIEGLLLTAPTVHNRALRAATEDLARAVREGGSLSAAMRRAEVFPPILVHMTASGEAGGQLETMLDSAADYLEREVGVVTSAVLSLLEPAIIILMGAVVATIVLSILLPILQIDTLALK